MWQGIGIAEAFPINGRVIAGEEMLVGGPTIESVGTAVKLNEHPVPMSKVDRYKEINLAYPAVERQIVDANPNRERWLGEAQIISGPIRGSGLIKPGFGFVNSFNMAQIQQAVGDDLMNSYPEPVNEPSKVINPPVYELYDESDKYREQELAKETSMSALTIATGVGIAGLAILLSTRNKINAFDKFLKFN